MATHKQALKRHRQSLKRRERNKRVKTSVKTRIKKVVEAINQKNPQEALTAFRVAQSFLSDAGRKGVIHKQTAARKTSRLARKVNALLRQQSA